LKVSELEGKMKEIVDVLINEYNSIKDFRERCIRNIEETTRTYLIFLGFGATSSAIFFEKQLPPIYMIFIMTICLIVGIIIYRLNIQTHINFINYTRKLNETRSFFSELKIPDKYFLLPTDGKHPEYDRIGVLNKRFSKHGSLKIIQLINSIIGGVEFFFIVGEVSPLFIFWISVGCKLCFSIFFGVIDLTPKN